MSFNYGREERKWRLWKEAEENKLRSLGVDEDTIEKLHNHDWEVFNSDRKYYRRLQDAGTYLEELPTEIEQPEINTVDEFLNSIENQKLYQLLIMVDKLTLQIVVMRWHCKVNMKKLGPEISQYRYATSRNSRLRFLDSLSPAHCAGVRLFKAE